LTSAQVARSARYGRLVCCHAHSHFAPHAWRFRNYSAREAGQSVARLEAVARLMDSQFVWPGTGFRFGLDPLVGLIPVVGDIISGLISTYLIWGRGGSAHPSG